MGLREQQNLLAKLYTDPVIRGRYASGQAAVAADFGLSDADALDLQAIASAEVEWFANSLLHKRLREVKRLLPVSTWMIGERFQADFKAFCADFNPTSVKKHLEDALAFARWFLRSETVSPLTDVLKFESTQLRHFSGERRISFCRLRHEVRPLFDFGRAGAETEIQERNGVAVWVRLGKRTRLFFL